MLASAAGIFKDRRIYVTGGNDNTVAIWDLTDHPVDEVELAPISNGKCLYPLPYSMAYVLTIPQMKWSIVWPNLYLSKQSHRAQSSRESATKARHSSDVTATTWGPRRNF